MNVGHVMPAENPETGLSASVNSYIKRVRWEVRFLFVLFIDSISNSNRMKFKKQNLKIEFSRKIFNERRNFIRPADLGLMPTLLGLKIKFLFQLNFCKK